MIQIIEIIIKIDILCIHFFVFHSLHFGCSILVTAFQSPVFQLPLKSLGAPWGYFLVKMRLKFGSFWAFWIYLGERILERKEFIKFKFGVYEDKEFKVLRLGNFGLFFLGGFTESTNIG